MSNSMAKQGFRRSASEMRKKISNLTMKWKTEKSRSSGWPYFDRIGSILSRYPQPDSTKAVKERPDSTKPRKIAPRIPVNSQNDMQEIVFITSADPINATDIEELLNMEHGEEAKSLPTDETSQQSLSTPNEDIPVDTTVESSSQVDSEKQPDQAGVENDDTSNPNNAVGILPEESSEGTPSKPSTDSGVTSSILPVKIKSDDPCPLPRIEKAFSITVKKPIASKTEHRKDEIDLYSELLASKLRNMDEKTRYMAMNTIDNILYKIKMDMYNNQHV